MHIETIKKLADILIIGIGNNSRMDDGLGWSFLELLEDKGFNDKHLLAKYQLMVEDEELISNYKTVIFVDASKEVTKDEVFIESLAPANEVFFSTHSIPPSQILHLCKTIYGDHPAAFLIKIKGYQWEMEIGLSEQGAINLHKAYDKFITHLIPVIKSD